MKSDMTASGLLKPSVSYGKSLRLSADQPMTIPEVLHKTAAAAGDQKGITYIQPDLQRLEKDRSFDCERTPPIRSEGSG
ncbi:hypothetical protein [Bacillus amyloliquefaciens]|uniref:hypothetical protein n=1 Tax=Bacillus amyloliquefaciens TaxID=1390 RepID=UPI0025A301CF|nr:hypothetical protein [Bacillus amyloliquefaciens]WJM56532.1 hypothetical protein QTN45_10955 [Bacillus amyloliquefaciens]